MKQFDPNLPGQMQGQITAMQVLVPNDPVMGQPNLVISPADPFIVRVEWEVYGFLVPVWLSGSLGPNWRVEVFAESVGPGPPDRRIGMESVPKDPWVACTAHTGAPHCRKWSVDVNVAAGTLPEGNPGGPVTSNSGLYKLAVVTFLNSTLPGPGYDVCGFREGPTILVENPI